MIEPDHGKDEAPAGPTAAEVAVEQAERYGCFT
jgi:hypothetical protein